jgi:hypothetical protein
MRTHRFPLGGAIAAVFALACALLASGAAAVTRPYDFGLTQVWSDCSAPGLYNVRLTFKPAADTTAYYVASGNQCQFRKVVCGINGGCGTVTCSGPGPCELVVAQCHQGRGGAWVGIAAPGRTQRVVTSAPRRCA